MPKSRSDQGQIETDDGAGLMTSVVIFRVEDRGDDFILAMADTRFVSQDASGKVLKTSLDAGSKLFSVPLKVSRDFAFVDGEETEYFIDTSIGIAFAGNATIGLNLAGALSQICPFLECHEGSCNLTLKDVATFSAKLLTDWHQKYNNFQLWKQVCEVAIFGICPKDSRKVAFHLKPGRSVTGIYEIQVNEFELQNPIDHALRNKLHDSDCHPWLILGDHRDDMEQLIKFRVGDALGICDLTQKRQVQAQFAPQYALEAAVHQNCFPTIGNGIQVLISDDRGTRPMRWIRPQSDDVPMDQYEWFSYLNYNVDDLGRIGNAEITKSGALPPTYCVPDNRDPWISEFDLCLDRILKRYRAIIISTEESQGDNE